MIISIDALKPIDKIQHWFMIKKKNFPQSGHRGNIPHHTDAFDCEQLMLLNCGVGEDSWESTGLQGEQTSQS